MNDYQRIRENLAAGSICAATVLSGPDAGRKYIWRDGEQPVISLPEDLIFPGIAEADGQSCYVERISGEAELVICGGGHISLELARLAEYMEYAYTVMDDRPEFCSRERFPGARECLCGSMPELLKEREFSSNACYVIVTRGHEADLECLEQILGKPAGYVGMIGSKAKVARTMTALAEKEFSQETLAKVHAPIGLKIGGQTPKEIAVSIVAELIQVMNQQLPASHFGAAVEQFLETGHAGVMLTIVGKRGSAPRGVGSRMIVSESAGESAGRQTGEKRLTGTIGGGLMEAAAASDAWEFLREDSGGRIRVRTYEVNNGSAAALGMWCGGSVDVMMEKMERI